jgi:hypothetical protein
VRRTRGGRRAIGLRIEDIRSAVRRFAGLARGLFSTSARSGGFGLRCSFATSGFGADLSGLAIGRFLSSVRFFLQGGSMRSL